MNSLIYTNYHTGNINKTEQLLLHAGLGALTSELTGNDALTGAVSGVMGEVVGEIYAKSAYGKTYNFTQQEKNVLKEIGGLSGAISSLIVGKVQGLEDDEMADNIFTGQRLGKNAVENNFLLPHEKMSLVKDLEKCGGNKDCENSIQNIYEDISEPRDEEFEIAMIKCSSVGNCERFNEIHYDLRNELTEEGNEYYNSLTQEQINNEFILLPKSESAFHTFQQDNNGNVINVTSGAIEGYTKYVHPIYGYEIVLDENKNIVTNPVNIGTYNFYNPHLGIGNNLIEDKGDVYHKNLGNHKKYDVDPYFFKGNSQEDTTTKIQRKQRLIYSIKEKVKENVK